MASETLNVPEEYLLEVIAVIREGLSAIVVSEVTHERLTEWCDEEEAYARGMGYTYTRPVG